jgi:Flp pilus assembly protein TadD
MSKSWSSNPNSNRQALLRLGAGEVAAGRLTAAEATYRVLVAADSADAEAWSNLAAVLNMSLRHTEAEAASRRALTVAPGHGPAFANLGAALHRQQRHFEAISAYVAALGVNPGDSNTATNLGVALAEQWRMAESLQMHDLALALAPDDPEIRCNRAMALLAGGDLAAGFAEFEQRWHIRAMPSHGFQGPQWLGEPAADRTILLHDEGGFGDTLQFIRYAPLLASRGARVVARVPAPLLRLLQTSMPQIAELVPHGAALPHHDLHCPMLSLPHAFATRLDTVPGQTPYLAADPGETASWRQRLAACRPGCGPLVGLVWAGAPRLGTQDFAAMDRRRSLPPDLLSPLAAIKNLRLVSLQHGSAASSPPPELDLFDPMAAMQDFADTAAIVACLDLVITVDTAMAHLAGALGKPVWLMTRHDACWRWLAQRTDSPWYPGMRVYRQPTPGAWTDILIDIANDLRRWCEEVSPAAGLSQIGTAGVHHQVAPLLERFAAGVEIHGAAERGAIIV